MKGIQFQILSVEARKETSKERVNLVGRKLLSIL